MAAGCVGAGALAAAALVAFLAPLTAAESRCDLEPWISDTSAPGEEGYHVLCATDTKSFEVYRSAVFTEKPEVFEVEEGVGFRKGLRQLLEINQFIKYAKGQNHPALKWKKQPWVVFTASGVELPVNGELKAISGLLEDADAGHGGVTLLLFEGGAWRWPTIRVGYRRDVLPGVWLRTVSRQPALFEVVIDTQAQPEGDGQLSLELLSNVVTIAEKRLEPSSMEGKVDTAVRSSDQTFLNYGMDPRLQKLESGTTALLRTTTDRLEHLQVLRYGVDQHYDAHRDYWDPREFPDVPRFTSPEGYWHQRFATLLWYLSAPDKGGETWFPRAHGGPIPWNEWMACDERGAIVSPANATAVLFYSLRADGEIDEYSWHCGCKVKEGVKWAANSWMSISPSRPRKKSARKEL